MGSDRESGSTSQKPLGFYDPGSSSWKTSPSSGQEASTLSPKIWPTSGMTCGGRLYERPTSGQPTTGIGGSDSRLPLFPTPKASDGPHGGPNQRNSKGEYDALPGMVVNLLPTPTTSDGTGGPGTSPSRKGGTNLRTAVNTLPAPDEHLVQDWGKYEPAVRRQEEWMGRPAPLPTEVGPRGGRRLTARFAEWLMGLPDGWVTDTPGLSRADQLHAIGNGVVPRQAYEAFRHLMQGLPG